MTGRIELLPEEVIRRIAAGEVVERPASVVKELLENALDASSSHIILEIAGSGKDLIRISDNGSGIHREDVPRALARHATSKIKSAQDLENLATFGFRGEALPSISQVSKMNLNTRFKEEEVGSEISLEGGKILFERECGRSEGTTIEVRDLFFNTPARLKFLKADGTEKQHLLHSFEEAALAHPLVWFELKNNSSKTISYPARKNWIDRIQDVWGENFTENNLIPLNFIHPFLQLTGWVSKPQFHQASKATQLFFINKRPIQSRSLNHALYESYRDCLPVGRHPVGLIFLEVDPSQVDFNVHPTKKEVRFRNESQIHDALLKEIRSKRSQLSDAPKVFTIPNSNTTIEKDGIGLEPLVNEIAACREETSDRLGLRCLTNPDEVGVRSFEGQSEVSSRRFGRVGENKRFQPNPILLIKQPARVLGQFQSLYILVEQEGNLLIVDQHAAAERILYEKFKKMALELKNVPTQTLLIPLFWNVTLSQAELIQNQLDAFRKLGFAIDFFGDKTFRVTEAPALIPETKLNEMLSEILSTFEDQTQAMLGVEETIMHAACRAAIKANDSLSNQELQQLLEDLSACSNPHTCPHGRPITLTLTRADLDKKFGRT